MSLYPFHTADEIAAFTKPQRAAYDRERAAFDLEVADLVATARLQGFLDLGMGQRFRLPVQLERGGRGVYRDTVGIGLRGQP